jgi:hypothetical protein
VPIYRRERITAEHLLLLKEEYPAKLGEVVGEAFDKTPTFPSRFARHLPLKREGCSANSPKNFYPKNYINEKSIISYNNNNFIGRRL